MKRTAWASSVIRGSVTHVRSGDVRHRFTYSYRSFLLDLDELPVLERRAPLLFGVDRARPLTLRTRDHLATEQGPDIRARVAACLTRHDMTAPGGRILGLVTLRGLGSGFDPVTVWFCHDTEDTLRAIIVDVHNTYGEAHPYAIEVDPDRSDPWVHAVLAKRFHVSPFLPQDGDYEVAILPPTIGGASDDERVVLRIAFTAHGSDDRIVAVQHGRRAPLRGPGLAAALLAEPLQGLRSAALIRFEALRLWRRGASFRHRPAWTPGSGHAHPNAQEGIHR